MLLAVSSSGIRSAFFYRDRPRKRNSRRFHEPRRRFRLVCDDAESVFYREQTRLAKVYRRVDCSETGRFFSPFFLWEDGHVAVLVFRPKMHYLNDLYVYLSSCECEFFQCSAIFFRFLLLDGFPLRKSWSRNDGCSHNPESSTTLRSLVRTADFAEFSLNILDPQTKFYFLNSRIPLLRRL